MSAEVELWMLKVVSQQEDDVKNLLEHRHLEFRGTSTAELAS